MFCSVGREFPSLADKSSSLFTGSQAFHIKNTKAYASNRKKETCHAAKQQKAQQKKGSRDIVRALRQMSPETEEKMKKLLSIGLCDITFSLGLVVERMYCSHIFKRKKPFLARWQENQSCQNKETKQGKQTA